MMMPWEKILKALLFDKQSNIVLIDLRINQNAIFLHMFSKEENL